MNELNCVLSEDDYLSDIDTESEEIVLKTASASVDEDIALKVSENINLPEVTINFSLDDNVLPQEFVLPFGNVPLPQANIVLPPENDSPRGSVVFPLGNVIYYIKLFTIR